MGGGDCNTLGMGLANWPMPVSVSPWSLESFSHVVVVMVVKTLNCRVALKYLSSGPLQKRFPTPAQKIW